VGEKFYRIKTLESIFGARYRLLLENEKYNNRVQGAMLPVGGSGRRSLPAKNQTKNQKPKNKNKKQRRQVK